MASAGGSASSPPPTRVQSGSIAAAALPAPRPDRVRLREGCEAGLMASWMGSRSDHEGGARGGCGTACAGACTHCRIAAPGHTSGATDAREPRKARMPALMLTLVSFSTSSAWVDRVYVSTLASFDGQQSHTTRKVAIAWSPAALAASKSCGCAARSPGSSTMTRRSVRVLRLMVVSRNGWQ